MTTAHVLVAVMSLSTMALSACEHDLDDGIDGFEPVYDFGNVEEQGLYDFDPSVSSRSAQAMRSACASTTTPENAAAVVAKSCSTPWV